MVSKSLTSTFIFQVFVFLQLLDFMTTVTGLRWGAQEANPIIQQMMGLGVVEGLLLCKSGILLAGLAVVWFRRERVILVTNYLFAGLIVWNLTQLMKLSV